MLEIKNITKIYKTYGLEQKALDKVSINFRKSEFVSILGPSGSGKTTLLNIIGGLDKYTSGDLIINGVSTKKYNDRDWDTYRNHKVGFVITKKVGEYVTDNEELVKVYMDKKDININELLSCFEIGPSVENKQSLIIDIID